MTPKVLVPLVLAILNSSRADETAQILDSLMRLVGQLPKHLRQRLIDAGCGIGRFSNSGLAARFREVYAFDPVPANIQVANERRNDLAGLGHGFGNVHYRVDRIENELAFLPAGAGMIMFNHVFYHLEESERQLALQRAYDSLAPGGVIAGVHNTPGSDSCKMHRHFGITNWDPRDTVQCALETLPGATIAAKNIPTRIHPLDAEEAALMAAFLARDAALDVSFDALQDYAQKFWRSSDGEGIYEVRFQQQLIAIHKAA